VQGAAPGFTVDLVKDNTPAEDDRIARRIEGTITAPCFLTNGCAPGGKFVLDEEGLPIQQGSTTFKYVCGIPRSALDPAAAAKARPALYGHGLLGSASEVDAGNVKSMSNEHNILFCATAWAGFASEDVPHIAGTVIPDFSKFDTVADRMQQGFLQQLLLGRALVHPQGFSSNPAFQKGGQSVIDTTRLFFDGNSQGGIMGGALTALAPDYDRAVLGVPGMNYSTLLQRSVDYDLYGSLINPAYPRQIERQLMFAVVQLLWDRGRLHHLDHGPDLRRAHTTAGTGARAFSNPWYAISSIGSFPYDGSAVVWWDAGTPASPLENVSNRAGEDPHGAPRSEVAARLQEVGVPQGRRQGDRRVRCGALLRAWVHGAVIRRS
jgi:hypothetical protein